MKYKTLKDWFLERQAEHPELGSYINLCYTIHGSGATRRDILKAFNELMPEEEYDKSEKRELVDYLCQKAADDEVERDREIVIKNSGNILYPSYPGRKA